MHTPRNANKYAIIDSQVAWLKFSSCRQLRHDSAIPLVGVLRWAELYYSSYYEVMVWLINRPCWVDLQR